jgi:hypothetical protein
MGGCDEMAGKLPRQIVHGRIAGTVGLGQSQKIS